MEVGRPAKRKGAGGGEREREPGSGEPALIGHLTHAYIGLLSYATHVRR